VGGDQGRLPNESRLLDILRLSIKQVPANKYAIGVVGIVAAAMLSILLAGGKWQPAVAGGVVIFGGMVLLRVFSASRSRGTEGHSQPLQTQALTWLIIVAFAVVLSLFIAKLYLTLFPAPDAAEPSVEVTSPLAEASINDVSYVVEGVSQHVRTGDRIWIALQSVKTGKYYVHFNHTQLASDGRWNASHVLLSVAQLDEDDFNLIALVVTPTAANFLRDYLENPHRDPALGELPAGAKPKCILRVKVAHPLQGYSGGLLLAEDTPSHIPTEVDQYVPVIFLWGQPASDEELWLVVHSESSNLFFPQPCVRTANSLPKLSCPIEVGAAADFGAQVQILVVQADQGAQRALTDYIVRIDRAGLRELPPDARILRTFTLRRKKAN